MIEVVDIGRKKFSVCNPIQLKCDHGTDRMRRRPKIDSISFSHQIKSNGSEWGETAHHIKGAHINFGEATMRERFA